MASETRRRPPRTRLKILVLALVSGVCISQLIGSFAAAISETSDVKVDAIDLDLQKDIWRYAPEGWDGPIPRGLMGSRFGYDVVQVLGLKDGDLVAVIRIETGWPVRSARSHYASLPNNVVTKSSGSWTLPRTLLGHKSDAVIPYAPLWAGLAVNTLLYGGVIWLVVGGRFERRRRRRRRRGLCLYCGYDLRSSLAECPECGLKPPLAGSETHKSAKPA